MTQEKDYSFLFKNQIYFGHQSVGDNIIEGVQKILLESEVSPLVFELPSKKIPIDEPGLYHSKLGENFDALSKIDNFKEIVESGRLKNCRLAFFKLCYVDIKQDANIEEIFNHYKTTLLKLEEDFPEITFLHCTVPLRSNQKGLKSTLKKALNIPLVNRLENIKRFEFNEKIRKEFSAKNNLFDIAYLESMSLSGKHLLSRYHGEKFEAMQNDYTSDGGHLNPLGSEYLAGKLLTFLKAQINE